MYALAEYGSNCVFCFLLQLSFGDYELPSQAAHRNAVEDHHQYEVGCHSAATAFCINLMRGAVDVLREAAWDREDHRDQGSAAAAEPEVTSLQYQAWPKQLRKCSRVGCARRHLRSTAGARRWVAGTGAERQSGLQQALPQPSLHSTAYALAFGLSSLARYH